jgi:hypothetical protein
VEREAARNHHGRRRPLARSCAARAPARPLAHHHRRRLCDPRGGTGRGRRGVGVPIVALSAYESRAGHRSVVPERPARQSSGEPNARRPDLFTSPA